MTRAGSVAAIFPGSSVPSRCFSLSGPTKAVGTGTCWSSAKPTSNAKGSDASRASASSSLGKESRLGALVATTEPMRTAGRSVRRACGPAEGGGLLWRLDGHAETELAHGCLLFDGQARDFGEQSGAPGTDGAAREAHR